ncbi:trihelix transcription factor ASIL2-like [Heracleum sosnowskyi]|uniref:Trihelix transcription factor ASIL2-like n=1 Tax=Heracleum sosnowskyi TaxID=360622 RepID=A0AAD8HK53_9APIA|nr:trihelix transcription factor ASIL2-like [Heracleum sosnowskyi]
MGDFTPLNSLPAVNPSPATRSMPFREDCWSEAATATLVDAWGQRYLELNRGNLRQKDWQAVADAVNSLHGHTKKLRRTDVQCKNRIDTIKKKYKIEKARVCETNGAFVSSWPFFDQLDVLIGVKKEGFTRRGTPGGSGLGIGRAEAFSNSRNGNGTPPMAIALRREAEREELPVAVVMPQKRSAAVVDDSYFRRNYSAMAAAAAKGEVEDEEETENEDEESEESGEERDEERVDVMEGNQGGSDGIKMLAKAIESFGEKYERIELEKLRQSRELEVKRIEVGRDIELQRTQMLYDIQVQMEKLKREKKKSLGTDKSSVMDKSSGLDDIYS